MSGGAADIPVVPGAVELSTLRRIARGSVGLSLDEASWQKIDSCHALLGKAIAEGRTIYGVNTGFGKLASTRIDAADLATLQRNLILSHCSGSGPELSEEAVRLVLALKAIALARGHSGVRREIVEMLVDLLRHGVCPCIPSKGSVGASGDLAPLAHLSRDPDRRRRGRASRAAACRRPKGSPSPASSRSSSARRKASP